VVAALRRHCPHARSLLEVGAGTGFVLEGVRAEFSGLAVTGTDALVASLSRAARRLQGAALCQMDARRIPFRDEFDALLALDVIEHIDEDETALREMRSALRPGGALVLTVPQHPWLWSTVDEWSGHRRRYTRRDLLGRLSAAGLRVAYVTSFTSLLLPLLALARFRRPKLQEFDPLAEVSIAPGTNAVLRFVSAVERALIRAGMTFPAGGSLLVVAHKPT
jgi:SAM-dependent methyltransferase